MPNKRRNSMFELRFTADLRFPDAAIALPIYSSHTFQGY